MKVFPESYNQGVEVFVLPELVKTFNISISLKKELISFVGVLPFLRTFIAYCFFVSFSSIK